MKRSLGLLVPLIKWLLVTWGGFEHTHGISIPSHSHSFTVANHIHKIELPDHKHDVEHKIVELNRTPSKVTIKVDGNEVDHDSASSNRIDLVD